MVAPACVPTLLSSPPAPVSLVLAVGEASGQSIHTGCLERRPKWGLAGSKDLPKSGSSLRNKPPSS